MIKQDELKMTAFRNWEYAAETGLGDQIYVITFCFPGFFYEDNLQLKMRFKFTKT